MKHTCRILKIEFITAVLLSLIFVFVYENDMLPIGIWEAEKSKEFVLVTLLELVTICVIPLSLRLFRFNKIHSRLIADGERSLLVWGSCRICMIGIPMIANTLLYYLFMNVAFGYMGIILFLCLFFVYPSENRCISETSKDE